MQTSCTSLNIDVSRYDIDVVISMASSLGTFILSSIIFLTVGLTCRYYHGSGRKRIKRQSHVKDPKIPVYKNINMRYEQQESELIENVAYIKRQESELIENVAYNCVHHSS